MLLTAASAAATAAGTAGPAAAAAAAPGEPEGADLASLPPGKAEEVAWWRLQRLKLLQLHDRLELAMVGDAS